MDEREQRIRERAYIIWEHEGRPEHQAERHWRLAQEAINEEETGGVAADPSGVVLTEEAVSGHGVQAPEPGPI
jgi:Protein of unknown function (DUF2934)